MLFVLFELVNLVPAGMVGNIHMVAGHVKAANDGEAPLAAPVEVHAEFTAWTALVDEYGIGIPAKVRS